MEGKIAGSQVPTQPMRAIITNRGTSVTWSGINIRLMLISINASLPGNFMRAKA